ncbi:MAG: histone deacetylase [Candidatus Bathyarchaeota archaeon]|nr:histone deacetylase [Candidatus Bathyarchaeota archaeon]
MTTNSSCILFSNAVQDYDFGQGHPLQGDRYTRFLPFLQANWPKTAPLQLIKAQPATDDDLLLISTPDYITFTSKYYREAYRGRVPNDWKTQFTKYQSLDNQPRQNSGNLEYAARTIVGQAKEGIDLLLQKNMKHAISIGGGMHHAKPEYGEGFCLYNDVAFAAHYMLNKYDLTRIAIIDTDAHAGNGTMEYFTDESHVLFIDFHQDPETLYPGTGFINQVGTGLGKGYTINIPLPILARYATYQAIFDNIIEPILWEFRPQMIIRNGGSDPHFKDNLTSLGLTVADFHRLGSKIRLYANTFCNGKVLDLIASGYNLDVLPFCWMALIAGLTNIEYAVHEPFPIPPKLKENTLADETQVLIKQLIKELSNHWNCF